MSQEILSLYPVFSDRPDILQALEGLTPTRVPAGQLLFEEHQSCAGFPLLMDGVVRVFKQSQQGREVLLYRIYPGEGCIVSLSCLIEHSPYPARGIAESELRLLMLPLPLFQEWSSDLSFQRYLLKLFSSRVDDLMHKVEEIAFYRLDVRLAGVLLGHGRVLHSSHAELASELNTVREMVSRLLKGFEKRGLVKLSREQIEIVDPVGLRTIAAGSSVTQVTDMSHKKDQD